MTKRTFLKLMALPSPFASAAGKLSNWAQNFEFSTTRVFDPQTRIALQSVVSREPNLRVIGTRHCFNRIADSQFGLVSLQGLPEGIVFDDAARTVTINPAMTYGKLCPVLGRRGFALHNLASLPHISIGGAISTSTHGSGEANGSLSTQVSALELLTASGETVKLSRAKDGETFPAAVVSLGALGILARVTLNLQPAFEVKQHVYENLPFAQLARNFDAIQAAAYSVSLFTDWQNGRVNEVWLKARADGAPGNVGQPEFFGATRAKRNLHPIAALSAENCTEQLGVAGPWYDRLPHFRMGFTPSAGKELQSEYFVPRSKAVDAILAVERLRDRITPHLMISEIRTIAADDLWLSPCYRRPSVAIHFTWKQEPAAVEQLLPLIERALSPYEPRPHWGKLFHMKPAYERLGDFVKLARHYDPKGKFVNEFLRHNIFS